MKIDDAQLRDFDKHWKCDEWGKWSRFLSSKQNIEAFGLEFKEERAYKVFVGSKFGIEELKKYCVSKTYFAFYNISPKIYNWGFKNGYYYIELDDAIKLPSSNNVKEDIYDRCPDWIKIYDIDLEKEKNYLNGYYLDFHGFDIEWHKFKDWFTKEAKKSHWGKQNEKNENYAYQETDIFSGKRNLKRRIEQMRLGAINFEGKTVLDIGCNLGMMSQYAANNGAKVVGVDCFKSFKFLADLYRFYKMIPNLEFKEVKLASDTIDQFGKFDIVFFFAMVHSLGIPKKLKDITKEILVFEGHNLQNEKQVRTVLEQMFPIVNFIGFTEDRGKRPVFYCYQSSKIAI